MIKKVADAGYAHKSNARELCEKMVPFEILADIASFHAATIYISVYEGDRTGIGRETTKGWQRNQKACTYEDAIRKYFDIHCKNGTIFTLKEKQP